MKTRINIIVAFVFLFGAVQAQSIKNIKASQDGTSVVIAYDLEDPEGKEFFIKAYASNDAGRNYNIGVSNAQGDVNGMVKAGAQKKIVWRAMDDVGEYQGMMRFKIVGLSNTSLGKSENKDFIMGVMDITSVSRDKVSIGISLFCKSPLTTALNDKSFLIDNFGNNYKMASGLIANQTVTTAQGFVANETKYGELIFQISKRHPSYVGGVPTEFQVRIEYGEGGSLFIPKVTVQKK